MSGTIHGNPGIPVAELGRIEKKITKSLAVKDQFQLATQLLQRQEYTARNIGAPAARKFVKEGKPILKILAQDSESFVGKAAKKGLKNLEKAAAPSEKN